MMNHATSCFLVTSSQTTVIDNLLPLSFKELLLNVQFSQGNGNWTFLARRNLDILSVSFTQLELSKHHQGPSSTNCVRVQWCGVLYKYTSINESSFNQKTRPLSIYRRDPLLIWIFLLSTHGILKNRENEYETTMFRQERMNGKRVTPPYRPYS